MLKHSSSKAAFFVNPLRVKYMNAAYNEIEVPQFLCEALHKFSETKLTSFVRNVCQHEKDLKVIGLQSGMSRISRLVEQVLLRKLKGKDRKSVV